MLKFFQPFNMQTLHLEILEITIIDLVPEK